jgi:16S rRNA (adenine1518-N6/adenine1519-N6)-dimethyltransferase
MAEIPSLRDTVEKYELLAKKSLGQNFLLDMNITRKIVRSSLAARHKADFAGENVIEVGPGPGGLTRAILEAKPQKLTVIEMDSRCIEIMRELKAVDTVNMQIVEGDALAYDFAAVPTPVNIISNLPYNISVPLLTGWLKNMPHYASLTLMFQKEVAERIVAVPNHKNYGRLSVLAQLTSKVTPLFNLPPTCFVPAPKIWSSVLLFEPQMRADVTPQVLENVEKITALAFGQRRKMIRQSLKALPNLEACCQAANIDLTARAENLTPEDYLYLALTKAVK